LNGIVGNGMLLIGCLLFDIGPVFLRRLGKDRRVSVQKIKKKSDTDNGFENLPHFTFSEESKWVLDELFAHYPPGDGDLWEMVGENSDTTNDKTKQKQDDIFSRPSMTKTEIARRLEALSSRINSVSNLKQVIFFSLSFQLPRPACRILLGNLYEFYCFKVDFELTELNIITLIIKWCNS